MNIYNKIRIIFLVSALVTTAFFSAFFYIQKESHVKQKEKRYIQTALYISKHFHQNRDKDNKSILEDSNLKLFLQESDFNIVKDKTKSDHVADNGHVLYSRKLANHRVEIVVKNAVLYLYLTAPRFKILLEDKLPVTPPWYILASYIFALLILVILYLWLTSSLRPLKSLLKQIAKVTDGDLTVSLSSNKNDEIAKVSNAFDDALRKLESLINSRQLFLRSIMHELKTPIAKGKLLNELLNDSQYQDSYEAVFERLELLIEEFAKIEKMLSSSYTVKLANYNSRDIVEQALELMIMDDDEIDQKVAITQEKPQSIYTDFDLLPLALKNLIDNAIKYSIDQSVQISISDDYIEISSRGKQFTDTLDKYSHPFHAQGEGLGLGLYIVHNITSLLNLKLEYTYTHDSNTFRISA